LKEEDNGIHIIIAKLEDLRESGELPELKENEKEQQNDKTKNRD
jgi:hypothetical protein